MRGSVARGTLLGFAGQAWHLVTAFLLYAFLARQLGPADFGSWRVVLSVLGWFEIVLHSGLIKVATQRIAESADAWRDYARASYVGQAIAAAGVLVIMLVLAGPVAASLSDPALATYVRISALDLPVYALLLAGTGVLLGQHRFERQIAASIVYATAKLVAVGLLVALGFSVTGALVGNAIASAVGFAVAFVPLPRSVRPRLPIAPLLQSMTVASVPFLTLSLVEGVGASADLWLVSALIASPIAVGWYASATVLAEIPLFLFGGLNNVLFPSVASARAEGDDRLASRYAVQAVRLALITTALAIALAASTGRQALTLLYSAKYLGAYVPLAILMVASMGRVVRTSCTEVLMAQGRRATSNAILVATVVLELALLWVLAARYGIAGAAVAAAASALVAGAWASLSLRDTLGARPLLTLMRCVLAAAVVGAALAWAKPAPAWLLVAYPVAVVVYGGVLRLLGEIDRDDIASVRSALRR